MANNYFSSQGTTVTTYAWTKLHAQIISWVSSVYESHLCMALNCSNHNCRPWFAQLWAILKCLQFYKQVSCHVCFQELINSWCFNFSRPCFRLHSGSSLHQLGSYSLVFSSTVLIENGMLGHHVTIQILPVNIIIARNWIVWRSWRWFL